MKEVALGTVRKGAALAALGALAACLLCGCAKFEGSFRVVAASGSFDATPAGTTAVLAVTAREGKTPKSGGTTWAVADTPNADANFAEMVAHVAATEAGMDVLTPADVAEKVEAVGGNSSLQSPPERLPLRARLLGCSSYLTAHVKAWRFRSVFFQAQAIVEFTLTCHAADDGALLWEVEVSRTAVGISDREVALLALRETFQWLKGAAPQALDSEPVP